MKDINFKIGIVNFDYSASPHHEKEDAESQYLYALSLIEAAAEIAKAAEAADALKRALPELSEMREVAYDTLEKSSAQGYLNAKVQVGKCLIDGLGVDCDARTGEAVIIDMSEQGCALAHIEIASAPTVRGRGRNEGCLTTRYKHYLIAIELEPALADSLKPRIEEIREELLAHALEVAKRGVEIDMQKITPNVNKRQVLRAELTPENVNAMEIRLAAGQAEPRKSRRTRREV